MAPDALNDGCAPRTERLDRAPEAAGLAMTAWSPRTCRRSGPSLHRSASDRREPPRVGCQTAPHADADPPRHEQPVLGTSLGGTPGRRLERPVPAISLGDH